MEHRKAQPQTENRIEDGVERRFASEGIEIRAAENGGSTLRGYALRFGSVYDMGWFTEEVDRRALDNTNMADVRVLLNHDPNNILGRTTAKTARVGVDDNGLWYEVDLPDSPNGQNARVAVERGDINQSSWGFRLRQDETGRTVGNKWEKRDGKEHRILTDVATIYDASPVTFPANPDTTVAKRSLDMSEKRDDMAEGAGSDGADAPTSWDIAYMVSSVAWATVLGNNTVMNINENMETYQRYAEANTPEAAVFKTLCDKCNEAKTAIVGMVDGHIDALKALNASENRTEEQKTNTEQINTFNPGILDMELSLRKARTRANKLNYEICN